MAADVSDRGGHDPMSRYAVGLDFGTASGRAVVVDVADGRDVAGATAEYPHGVIDETLPIDGPVVRLAPSTS
jgi:L-ribulokinase